MRLRSGQSTASTNASLAVLLLVTAGWVCLAFAVGLAQLQAAANAQPIRVRFVDTVTPADRSAVEAELGLSEGSPGEPRTWTYRPRKRSARDIQAIVSHPSIEDTHHIDRSSFRVQFDRPNLPIIVRETAESGGLAWISALLFLAWALAVGATRREHRRFAQWVVAGLDGLFSRAEAWLAEASTLRRLALPVTVTVLVLVVGGVSTLLWRASFDHRPLWIEHAAYGLWANSVFLDSLAGEGYLQALRDALGTRHILQPAILGLVSPSLLASPQSHVLVAAGTLAAFLSLLTLYVLRRTGSFLLAACAPMIFCCLAGLYDELNGIGVPWPDYQAMFLLASAVLSMGLYALSGQIRWLAWTGAFASLAVLARDTAGIYTGLTCVPPAGFLLARDLRNGRPWPDVVRRAAVGVTMALPGMWVLAAKAAFLRSYYMTSNVQQLRQPLSVAAHSIWELFSRFSGFPVLGGLCLLLAGALFVWPRRQWEAADLVILYWPASFLAMLLANGYTSDVMKEVMYMAPGLVCATMTLGGGMNMRWRSARILVMAVVLVCAVRAKERVVQSYDWATHPDAGALAIRDAENALSEALVSIPRTVAWHSYAHVDWGTVVSAMTLYTFGHHQPTENVWFHNSRNYWDARFPGLDLVALRAHIFDQAEARVDVAIVMSDPGTKPGTMDDYSYDIARYVAEHVAASPNWRHYRDVNTAVSGPLSLYLNVRRLGTSAPTTARRD